jgi:hypothetical protein
MSVLASFDASYQRHLAGHRQILQAIAAEEAKFANIDEFGIERRGMCDTAQNCHAAWALTAHRPFLTRPHGPAPSWRSLAEGGDDVFA